MRHLQRADKSDWPDALARYVDADGMLRFHFEGLSPGQLPMIVIVGLAMVVAVVGVVVSRPRFEIALCAAVFGALLAWPASELLAWTRISRLDDAWEIATGVWRWRKRVVRVPRPTIQGALVIKDRLGYALGFRGEHVQLIVAADRFAGPAQTLEIAEQYRLDRAILEALALALAAKSG